MKKYIIAVLAALLCRYGCASSTAYSASSAAEETECSHVWSAATCVALSCCEKCGETRGELAAHSFAGGTCTEAEKCSVCGAEGKRKDHDFQGGDCRTPEICTDCGAEGERKPHDFQGGTCVDPEKCTVCGAEGERKDHEFSEATCMDMGICAVCGETIPALGHDMRDATCTEAAVCVRCGYTEGNALGHTGPGTCTRCGEYVEPKFEIITEPGTIQRGSTATVTICAEPNTEYHITVYVKSGQSEANGLEAKTSDGAGYVSWSWKVGSRATGGTYRIVISGCGETKTLEYTILE